MNTTTERELAIAMDLAADLSARKSALDRLASMRDADAVPPLAVLLTEIEPVLIADVKRTLTALHATEILAARAAHPSDDERARAVRLLGYLEDDAAIPALLTALDDPNARVRAQAADGLIRLCPTSVVAPLESKLFGDPDPQVRMAAAQALGEIADEPSLSALHRALETETDGFVRVVVELSCHRAERISDDRDFWS